MSVPTLQVEPAQVDSFYASAWLALSALDPTGRRFSANADAAWKALGGDLREADRLDLLIRDLAVTQPLAFAPRSIFAIDWLSEDEPFGPSWPGCPPTLLSRLLKSRPSPRSMQDALDGVVTAWSLPEQSKELERPAPAARYLVSGHDAIVAAASAFEGRSELDFADQVILVTDSPAERQLFGVAAALLGAQKRPRALRADTTVEDLRRAKADRIAAAWTSGDGAGARTAIALAAEK